MKSVLDFILGRGLVPWILGLLAVVMAIITIFEAKEVNPPTPFWMYQTWWFYALLGVFCLNVVAVFLRRDLLRVDKWPNQFMHLGLVLVLMGGFISWRYGVDGYVRVAEGQTVDYFWGKTPTLLLREGNLRRRIDLGDPAEAAGREVTAPGGARFRVTLSIPSARKTDDGYVAHESEHMSPAIRLKAVDGDGAVWLAAEGKTETIGEVELSMTRRRPLGYSVTMIDAQQVNWPASGIPRAFYSWVRVEDADRGFSREWKIETNDPMSYGGYRFYQSGMDKDERTGQYFSGFSVRSDPGLIWVTIGIVMCGLGMFVLYALRFVRDPLHARRRRRAAGGSRPLPTAPPPIDPGVEGGAA